MAVLPQAPSLEPQVSLRITADASAADWDSYVFRHPDATADHLSCWRGIFERVFGHRAAYLRGAPIGRHCRRVATGVVPFPFVRPFDRLDAVSELRRFADR